MLRVVFNRLLAAIPVLLGVSVVVFFMAYLAPGDPAEALLGPLRTQETLAEARQQLGLDRPIIVQFGDWVAHAATGDLGESIRLNKPVSSELAYRFKNSLFLAVGAFTISVSVGIAIGVIAARRRGGLVDQTFMALTMTGVSLPPFYFGMLLIILFSVKLDWLPTGGMYDARAEPSTRQLLVHLILPTLTLAAVPVAVIARMMRSSMLEVINADYMRTARAKGLSERQLILGHALRNALIPVTSIIGLQVGYLLSATALVEVVFGWPGLGSLLVDSVVKRDLPLTQGAVLLIAAIYVVVNIVSDVVQALLDPRIEAA
jgi:peptide/nickel transport system permease protein